MKKKSGNRLKYLIMGQVFATKGLSKIGRPVAWLTSGAPVEPVIAAGYLPFYPENHSAICAAKGIGGKLCQRTESLRYSRDLCSYFRVDIGSQELKESPLGLFPPPDIVVASNNICGTVQNWFRIIAERYSVPFFFIDTPFSDDMQTEADIKYVEDQLVEYTHKVFEIAGNKYSEKRLKSVLVRSKKALQLWDRVLSFGKLQPAVFTSFDAFVHMYPIVTLRGTIWAQWYYEQLVKDLEDMQKHKIPALKNEKARVVWDNIAIWPIHRELRRFFKENGIALVADDYTSAWHSEYIDPEDPYHTLALSYTDIILNHGAANRVNRMVQLIEEFKADGFILHSNRSCKRWSLGAYAVKRLITERTGVPGVVIEADMADPRAVSIDYIKHRLTPFFEMLTGGWG